ncbi:hypothetical protein IE4771_CH01939 [Rhizobium etli bv. mimosae str. IE4771]|uniref:Uncharacterized protein n=1 Tax=Rhizobium etli bv. mimosae str. IE4771 TaxID=1432050 RepID=A0A060I6D1_RHIET|nr:hypothetical protein [Rhizobium sp. IE4771]AIC27056.1 hypothetical protein IE4771_CH01939 [Rhizobium sp. IE4771]
MSIIVDDKVYFIQRQKHGSFYLDATFSLSDLGGTVPGFGDRYALAIHKSGTAIAEVVGRYFLRHIDEKAGNEWYAWFIVVQEVSLREQDDLFRIFSTVYKEDIRGNPVKQKRAAKRDSEEKGFEYWENQDRQREKHAPLHKLDAREQRILRFMIAHPECQTTDMIPEAGEKTMDALAKVGVLRPGAKDHTGQREWFVTDEGRAEVNRIDTWTNWKF